MAQGGQRAALSATQTRQQADTVRTQAEAGQCGPNLWAMETDAHRPKRDRRTAKMLYEAIRQDGYTGCYAQVTGFFRRSREQSTVLNQHGWSI